jgi:glycosyltransferase involved in cell wall biosynthesis
MLTGANKFSKTWVIIPAYNESQAICPVLDELKLYFNRHQIVVIDDCSSDQTAAVTKEIGCAVITHPINLGQGAAIQTGLVYALHHGAEFIITFDSDGQHRVTDAVNMLNTLNTNECKVVCGSRFLGVKAKNMSISKLLTLKLAIFFTRITTGIKVTDAHNGLRVITKSAAKLINIKQNRMAHASELIKIIKNNNINYIEYPVQIIYTPYSINKGQKISNSINILIDLLIGRFDK